MRMTRQCHITRYLHPMTGRWKIIMLLGMLLLHHVISAPMVQAARNFHTTVGFSVSTFMHVDKNRAQAITQLWTDLVARKWGGTASTRVYNSLAELERAVTSKNIDLAVLLAGEYLEIRENTPMEPLFISVKENNIYDHLILVVRRDGNVRVLSDLKGGTLIQQSGLYANGRNLWLDPLLMQRGISSPNRFFSSDRKALKPSSAVLPVFFRKADACIVAASSFRVMAELNPQLREELSILEQSPPRPSSVIAVRKGLPAQQREMVLEVLGTLDQTTQGKQLLTLFRMHRLIPYKTEYFVALEKLFREHRELRSQLAKRRHHVTH